MVVPSFCSSAKSFRCPCQFLLANLPGLHYGLPRNENVYKVIYLFTWSPELACETFYFPLLEHPQQWSYFFNYLALQKATLFILPTHFTTHLEAVDLF